MKKLVLFFTCALLFHSTIYGQKYEFDREISGYTQTPALINYSGLIAIAVDASANVYALTSDKYYIQKTTPTGQFIRKWGSCGKDVSAFDALPKDIAIDINTNSVYVLTDSYIHKFTTDGVFIKKWIKNGSAAVGHFSELAIDASGNVYAHDYYNGYIQIFNSSGDFISQWTVQSSVNSYTNGMTFDASGNLHLTDHNSKRILKYSNTGAFLGQWGTAGTGTGQLTSPSDIDIDVNGNVYVADNDLLTIHKFASDGTFIEDIGNGIYNTINYLQFPNCIALDASENIYVNNGGSIQKITNNIFVTKWGQYDGDAQILRPAGIVVNSNQEISIATNINVRIQKFSNTGTPLSAITIPQPQNYPDYFHINLMEMDTDGNINALIGGYLKKFDTNGVLISQSTSTLAGGTDIALDNLGHIYVAVNGDIKKYTLDGTFIKQWSLPDYAVVVGVAADAYGNVYAGNPKTRSIMKYNSEGDLLGGWNGLGPNSPDVQIISMSTLTLDASGNIYANNPYSNYVQKFSPDGVLLAKIGESGTGPGQLLTPASVAIDLSGNVYVSDYGNDRIQIFKPYTSTPSSKIRVFSGNEEILLGGSYDMGIITSPTTTLPFTIKNRNEATTALTLTEALSLSNASAGFTLVQNAVSSPIAVGGSTPFTISYTSTNLTTPGIFTATVTIKNNDVDAPSFTFKVIATIPVPPVSKIAVSSGMQIASGSTFDFGTINTDAAGFFSITNQSSATAPLTLTGTSPITLSNVNAGFTVNQTALTSPLAINGSTSFTIYFTRTSAMDAGQVSTMVSIANDDPTKNPFIFTVTATIPPSPVSKITVSQGAQQIAAGSIYNLGTVSTAAVTLPFTITNQSTATAALSLTGTPPVTLSNVDAGFSIDQTTINPYIVINGNTSFTISFSPASTMASGQVSAIVSIANNDLTKNPFTFTVTATVANTTTSISYTEANIFVVYPNPSNGNFTINSSYDIQSITLINSIGQIQHITSKDITTNFKGIVVIEVITTQGISIQKLVIE